MNQEYLNKIRDIQDHLIELIENQFANDNDINIFTGFLQDQKISKNQHELKDFLHLILKISIITIILRTFMTKSKKFSLS